MAATSREQTWKVAPLREHVSVVTSLDDRTLLVRVGMPQKRSGERT
jgi:hypothetical protein